MTKDQLDSINTWMQGKFIDGPRYRLMSDQEKTKHGIRENVLVRSHPKGNAICTCADSVTAEWLARRLNFAHDAKQEIEDLEGEVGCLQEKIHELEAEVLKNGRSTKT